MKKKSILHFIHSRFIFQHTMFLQFFKFVFSISFLAWFLLYYDDWLLLSPLPVRAQIVLTLTLSRTFTAHPQFVYQFFLVASHRKKNGISVWHCLSQFLCCQNIKLFLDTCRKFYRLPESELFEPTMLYNLTDFHRVLITLSKLSKIVAQSHPHLT